MTLAIVRREGDPGAFDEFIRERAKAASERLGKLGISAEDLLSTPVGFLTLLGTFRGKPLDLDLYQQRYLTLPRSVRRRSMNKARQVGFSFCVAADCLARCHLEDTFLGVVVSYNLSDAKEKIQYIKEIHDELPLEFQKRMVRDSKTEVAFMSRTMRRQVSTVLSYPSKAPRGKTGSVYLDELAHCRNDRAIYAGANALIARSGGTLTIGSTPLARRGTFYEIHSGEGGEYRGFFRQNVPWWLCRHFSRDVERAAKEASLMETEARVRAFGTADLVDQFESYLLDDFRQEFELAWQDERVAFFPYDLVAPCCAKDREEIPVYDTLERLSLEAPKLGTFVAGYDVGRMKHPSELAVFERSGDGYVCRYEETLRDAPFALQRDRLAALFHALGDRLEVLRIDATGFGMNLSEDLQRKHGRRVEGWTFSDRSKSELANSLKILFERRAIVLPRDRNLVSQLHSVKQRFTAAGNVVFDVEKAARSHADRVWSIALATFSRQRPKRVPGTAEVRVLGERSVEERREEARVGIVDKLFAVPAEPTRPEPAPADVLAAATTAELELRGRQILTSLRVWKREGEHEKGRLWWGEYKRIRREVARRASGPEEDEA